jgi:hypothetical protein
LKTSASGEEGAMENYISSKKKKKNSYIRIEKGKCGG